VQGRKWQWQLAGVLLALSVIFYGLEYAIFHDLRQIVLYLVSNIAFVFVQVLLVTLIIDRVLQERERQARLENLNMAIGTFFSEVGTKLLRVLSDPDPNAEQLRAQLIVGARWTDEEFGRKRKWARDHPYEADTDQVDWAALKSFLVGKRDFLLRLLENPNLLEHEAFTEMLRAVFHLVDELGARERFDALPRSDYAHLASDMKRAYLRLVDEWLDYMKYLKASYPYLFSLAVRTNPFDRSASVVVQEDRQMEFIG
jgi:hypothetical protein